MWPWESYLTTLGFSFLIGNAASWAPQVPRYHQTQSCLDPETEQCFQRIVFEAPLTYAYAEKISQRNDSDCLNDSPSFFSLAHGSDSKHLCTYYRKITFNKF